MMTIYVSLTRRLACAHAHWRDVSTGVSWLFGVTLGSCWACYAANCGGRLSQSAQHSALASSLHGLYGDMIRLVRLARQWQHSCQNPSVCVWGGVLLHVG
jgi:hypothetical protein